MSDEKCGETNTSSGDPCQWDEGDRGPCPWHNDETPAADTRNTILEDQPEVKDIIVGELQAGATVPEACAEAGMRKAAYYKWRKRGEENPDSIFGEFRDETTRARRIASKEDRRQLKQRCMENDDTRTWYKLHHDQYGDTYGQEEEDERETGETVVIHTDEQSVTNELKN